MVKQSFLRLGACGFLLLTVWKAQPWMVVILLAAAGGLSAGL